MNTLPERPGPLLAYRLTVLALFALFGLQLWLHATRTSATFDEPPHILAGYRYWQCGDFAINPEHPPFLKLLAAAPLLAENLPWQPAWPCGSRITPKVDSFQAGNEFLTRNGAEATLVPARLAAASLSMLLAILVFCAAREMFGRREAAVALALLAFEPNLVAHGSLVTTDMAVTTMMFAAVYALYRYRERPTPLRFALVALATGLTLSAKFSGVLVFFLLPVVDLLALGRERANGAAPARLLPRLASLAAMLLAGLAVLWATYGFHHGALPSAPGTSLAAHNVTAPPAIRALVAAGEARLVPDAYAFGLAAVVEVSNSPAFLLGTAYRSGQWFYFPAAFAIKTSLPLLALLGLAAFTPRLFRERPAQTLALLIPASLFFVVSLASKLNIGVRHILPVYPFFIVIAAAGACAWSRERRTFACGVAGLLCLHAITAWRVMPNDLAFSNALWGGVDATHRYLRDSNVDWGQNLPQVRAYLAREHVTQCWFAPFGNGSVVRQGQPCRLLPGAWDWDVADPVEAVPAVIDGTILVSTANLPPSGGLDYEPLTREPPVALIGGGIAVYRGRFDLPLAAAVRHVERARQARDAGRTDEAVAEAQSAVALAPRDLRSHLALGVMLAQAGKTEAARAEFGVADHLAATQPELFIWDDILARDDLRRLRSGELAPADAD